MEVATSQLFNDYVDYGAPSSFHSLDQDIEGGGIFNQFTTRADVGRPPTPDDGGDGEMRQDIWSNFADPTGQEMDMLDQRTLFAGQGICSPASDDGDAQPQIEVFPSNMPCQSGSSSKRTSKSNSFDTDITLPDEESPDEAPPKKRKAGKNKKKKGPDMTEDEEKRQKFLHRNRIAAMKCRQKKKDYVARLESLKIRLEMKNFQLRHEQDRLNAEVTDLKVLLMRHANCRDKNIDRWLENSASRIALTPKTEAFRSSFSFEQSPQSAPALDQNNQYPFPTGSPNSRNHSTASSYSPLQCVPSLQQFEGFIPRERQGSIAYSHGKRSWCLSPQNPVLDCPDSQSQFPRGFLALPLAH